MPLSTNFWAFTDAGRFQPTKSLAENLYNPEKLKLLAEAEAAARAEAMAGADQEELEADLLEFDTSCLSELYKTAGAGFRLIMLRDPTLRTMLYEDDDDGDDEEDDEEDDAMDDEEEESSPLAELSSVAPSSGAPPSESVASQGASESVASQQHPVVIKDVEEEAEEDDEEDELASLPVMRLFGTPSVGEPPSVEKKGSTEAEKENAAV